MSEPQSTVEPTLERTPSQIDSKKRPLSSPLETLEPKKKLSNIMEITDHQTPNISTLSQDVRHGDTTSQPVTNISFGAEEMDIIAKTLKSSFEKDMEKVFKSFLDPSVQKIIDRVLVGLNKRIEFLENENKFEIRK